MNRIVDRTPFVVLVAVAALNGLALGLALARLMYDLVAGR